MNCGEIFVVRYLDEILKILESAAKLSLQCVSEEEDPDLN